MASDPPPPFTALCEVPFPTAAATPFESPEHPASSTYPAARLLATTASWQAATASATDVAVPLAVAVLDGPSGGESAFLLAALQTLYDAFLTPLGPILHRLCQRAPLSADRNAPAAATAAVSGGAPGTPVSGAAPPLPPSPAAYGPAALADLAEQLLLIPQRIEKVMQEQLTRDGLAHLPYITSDDLLVDDDNDETNDAKADAEPSSKADKSANEASAAADADGGSAEDDAQNDDEIRRAPSVDHLNRTDHYVCAALWCVLRTGGRARARFRRTRVDAYHGRPCD
ncbi:hypothetical protein CAUPRSCDRAFT_13282 [Caulochytrium protostelioides]|uniref:Uncharacterized protein n=1 Tax=Caulochytrium protostelioides TaxID=1555241 RepID=A0A4V1ISV6_9FUNG|nr:hypothetical protein CAUPRSCDRAFT_13282 [Caulochytrium protostelioides]